MLPQRSKHPREMVITPKASTSILVRTNPPPPKKQKNVHLCRCVSLSMHRSISFFYHLFSASPAVVGCKIPRKENSPIFVFLCTPPLVFPRVYPRLTRRSIKPSAPDKKIGLIKTFSRVYPKKGKHAPGKQKNRRFHAKSTSFIFTVSCSQLC